MIPKERWDAVVVGAGLGGLAAAARLRKEGLSVLVLDRNAHPGGTAWSFRRRGFTFPMGPLGFGSPALVRGLLRGLTGGEGPPFTRVHYRLRAFGLDLPLSLPFPDMVRALGSAFPGEEDAAARFFAAVENADARTAGEIPAAEAIRAADPRLRRILGSQGTEPPYSSLALLAAMWRLLCQEGIWTPPGGVRSLADQLAGHAGEVRTNVAVARILVREGKAAGVVLADGTEIAAGGVISNADFKRTFLGMLPTESIPPEWRRAVAQARQTGSILQVSLGVDLSRVDLSGFREDGRIIHRRTGGEDLPAPDWSAPRLQPALLGGQEMEIALLSRDDPFFAPAGGAALLIRTPADYRHFISFRRGWRKRTPEYAAYKKLLGEAMAAEAESVVPGLKGAVRVLDVATPLTFEDQGGRSEGAVAGWSWDFADSSDSGSRDLTRTPIRGLYMAGYQALSALFAGGVATALQTGVLAAERLLKGEGPVMEVIIPMR